MSDLVGNPEGSFSHDAAPMAYAFNKVAQKPGLILSLTLWQIPNIFFNNRAHLTRFQF